MLGYMQPLTGARWVLMSLFPGFLSQGLKTHEMHFNAVLQAACKQDFCKEQNGADAQLWDNADTHAEHASSQNELKRGKDRGVFCS